MKKSLLGIVLTVFMILSLAPGATAYWVNVDRLPGTYFGSGGEFSINYGSFQTFCLETNEHITIPGRYWAIDNTAAVLGGAGGGSPDPVSIGTAWLYSQFAAGNLAGYLTDTVAHHVASAGALQEAIWWLEDEIVAQPVNNIFVQAVINQFNDPKADANGAYHVYAMNLYPDDEHLRTYKQDMLKVPEPSTLLLLGFGLIGLTLAGRRRFIK